MTDPAEARRQRETLDTLRRLEDIVGDTNREAVRHEGRLRDLEGQLEAGVIAIRRDLARLIDGEGGAGVREPAPPRPESPGDAIALDYGESAE